MSNCQVDDLQPTQEWALTEDTEGTKQYETLISKFGGLHSLTLYFDSNFGADTTRIYCIHLRGESNKVSQC